METKIIKYQQIILSILEEYAPHIPINTPEIEHQIIADTLRHHYQLVAVGWSKEGFIHDTIFHFDIKPNGKIWIQANWTDTEIGQQLMSMGVERTDIVVGFLNPKHRAYAGYAVENTPQ